MIIFNGRLYFLYFSTSAPSPKVQHIITPVPLSFSTLSSNKIGTSTPSGVIATLPSYFALSSGCAKIATQAGKSSGLVVIMTSLSSQASSLHP